MPSCDNGESDVTCEFDEGFMTTRYYEDLFKEPLI